jgi:acyl-coenzyme A synthetase/AMP-(fatty) acid ligase
LNVKAVVTPTANLMNVVKVITIGKPQTVGYHSYVSALFEGGEEPEIEVSEEDDLEILYTSGTTGRPKGALFDHKRIFNVGISVTINMGLRPHERILNVAPIFHSA